MVGVDHDPIPGAQYAFNTNQRTPCVLLMDCSGSMADQMVAVNQGLKDLQAALQNDSAARERIALLVVRVGDELAEPVGDWIDAIDFAAPTLEASGRTPLGQGLSVSLRKIEQAKNEMRSADISYSRPIIYMITDGAATDKDEWESALREVQSAIAGKHVQLFSIGTATADIEELKRAGGTVLRLDSLRWGELFKFISNSMAGASKAELGGTTQVTLPASVTIAS